MRRCRASANAVAVWCAVVAIAVPAVLMGAAPAHGHAWQDHYNNGAYTSRWDVRDISWYFDANYGNRSADYLTRAREATATWSNVLANANGYVQFRERGVSSYGSYEQCTYNAGVNYLRWASLTSGPAATTWYCFRPSPVEDEWSVSGFSITIDADPTFGSGSPATWYTGTGTGGFTEVDLLSALTHEFGHAAGHARHFDDAALCPTDAAADHSQSPTMCAGVWYGNDTNRRTLEGHDVHTMQAAYANPPSPPPTTSPGGGGGGGGTLPSCNIYSGAGIDTVGALGDFVRRCT